MHSIQENQLIQQDQISEQYKLLIRIVTAKIRKLLRKLDRDFLQLNAGLQSFLGNLSC